MTKSKKLPVRNINAEVAIQVGAVGIILSGIFYILLAFIMNAFNDTGSPYNVPIGLLIFIFAISVIVQAVKVLRESDRVDHYRERLIAVYLMLVLPLQFFTMTVLSSFFARKNYEALASGVGNSNQYPPLLAILTSPLLMIVGAVVLLAGSAWLWVLLAEKKKLVWIVTSVKKNKETVKKSEERIKRNRRLGLLFLLMPVVLFILMILTAFGTMGQGYHLMFAFRTVLDYGWLPSVIIGIIFLIKSKN